MNRLHDLIVAGAAVVGCVAALAIMVNLML